MNRDTNIEARVVCDRKNGIVYVNDVPIDGYVTEDGISVDPGGREELMVVRLDIFAGSIEMVDDYQPRVGITTSGAGIGRADTEDPRGYVEDPGTQVGLGVQYPGDVGVCYLALPTLNPSLIGKVINEGEIVGG